MNKKETIIHEAIGMNLTNLLDKIDLCIYHLQTSHEDYDHHIYDMLQIKKRAKRVLNADFDKLAINKKK